MVDIAEVQAAAYRIAKIGTSGYDSTPEFIAKANEVNTDLMNILTPHYGSIEALDDILGFLVQESTAIFTSGVLDKPDNYYGFISLYKTAAGNSSTIRKMSTNQIGAIGQNSIRKPTVASPKYYFRDDKIILKPSNGDAGLTHVWFRDPLPVAMTVTPVGDDDDDYETVTAQTDYEWPARVKNLIIYLLVQRLGVEMKESVLFEVAQLGINQNLTVNSPDSKK